MSFYTELQQATAQHKQSLYSIPLIQAALKGDVSIEQYVDYLTEAYHHVKHTLPLLMACGANVSIEQEWLRVAMAGYIAEEIGHQEWILSDIDAAGGNANKVRAGQPGLHTDIMVAYAYDTIARKNPVGFLGMVYVLEHTSTELATGAADTLKANLGLPAEAFSYLTSHGTLDLEHIAFYEKLVNQLDQKEDQIAVIANAKVFYYLYGNIFASLALFYILLFSFPILLYFINIGLNRGTRSLNGLSEKIALRTENDLSPIKVEDVPLEIKGMVDALNKLMSKVSTALGRERQFISDAEHQQIVSIIDQGPGIPEDQHQRVFDRFYRNIDSQSEGSGLGLAIARKIAALHQAEIILDAAKSGEGLSVKVIFRANSGKT
jgi:pyrroloquinoline quinone (PQQ) biosynthesis protein C